MTFLILLCFFLHKTRSANVLMVVTTPFASHQKVFSEVWSTLVQRPHNLHVVTPIPAFYSNINNTTTIYDISDVFPKMFTIPHFLESMVKIYETPTFMGLFRRKYLMANYNNILQKETFKHSEVQRLLRTEIKFDACIVDWLYPTLAVFAHYFQCPLITLSSGAVMLPSLDAMGNPAHPVLAPDQDLPVSRDMTFLERVWSGVWAIYVRIYQELINLPRDEQIIKEYFGGDLPPLRKMIANTSLLLLNTNIVFHRPVPILPTVIQFGGRKNKKSLPMNERRLEKDLEQFITNSQDGVVYFSFGSGVRPEEALDPSIVKIFQDTFSSLPFNFVWKWNGSTKNMPRNVLTRAWLPQEAILSHPNVKLFIYQGGLQSTEEAMSAHTPVIGIPFHFDQTYNIYRCVEYGVGEVIHLEQITVERLRSLILKVYDNPSYIQNAKKLDMLIKDQPMDGLDKAVWWIEYVIRHKGAHHLRSPAATMPLWQYLMLDVIAFILATMYVSYKIIRFFCAMAVRFVKNRIKSKVD